MIPKKVGDRRVSTVKGQESRGHYGREFCVTTTSHELMTAD